MYSRGTNGRLRLYGFLRSGIGVIYPIYENRFVLIRNNRRVLTSHLTGMFTNIHLSSKSIGVRFIKLRQ